MAKVKKKTTALVAQEKGLTILSNWRERVTANTAASLQEGVGAEAGGSLTFGTGRIEYKENDLGNEIDLIIVGSVPARAYYKGAYDPKVKSSPDCYSNDSIKPDPTVLKPISAGCKTCPLNAYGTAKVDGGKGGGKGCKQGYKIAAVHADALAKGNLATADIVTAKFSVTASKPVAKYLLGTGGIPFQTVTHLAVKPDKNTKYVVALSRGFPIDDADQEILGSRIDEVEALLTQSYPQPDPAQQKTTKKRGTVTRRKVA